MDKKADDLTGHHSDEFDGSSDGHAQIKPRGKPFSRRIDWHVVALVGASVAAGAAVGAGIALLTAPQSGEHTRLSLARQLRRHRPRSESPWEKLSEELHKAARRKRFRRAASSGRDEETD